MTSSGLLLRLSDGLKLLRQSRRGPSGLSGSGEVRPEDLFLRAKSLLRNGDKAIALSLLDQAFKLDPTYSDALELQGEILDSVGDSGAAAAKYRLARSARQNARGGAPDRHFVLRHRKPITAQVFAYNSVLNSLKKNILPYLARGNAHLVGGQYQLALADYETAIKMRPGLLDAIVLKGEALSAMGRYEEASQVFGQVLAARPNDASTLNARGIACMALGRVDEANADWRRQLELVRDRPAASAYVCLRLADYSAALPHLRAAADHLDAYWTLYQRTAEIRLGMPAPIFDGSLDDSWPGLLLKLQAGAVTREEVLARADTAGRRAEALFQCGVVEHDRNRATAIACWQEVADRGPPTFVEYAAAQNELRRAAKQSAI